MHKEQAAHGNLSQHLQQLSIHLDQFLQFKNPDAMSNATAWKKELGGPIELASTK